MDFTILTYRIEGVVPLLMHSGLISPNPFHPLTKLMKTYSGKRKKTDRDLEILSQLEWFASLYLDEPGKAEIGGEQVSLTGGNVIFPSQNIEALLRSGAKRQRLGTQFKSGVFCLEDFPLQFPDDDKSVQELWDMGIYCDMRPVKVQRNTIMRSRPIFKEWSLDFAVQVDTTIINPSQVTEALVSAGRYCGALDYTPRFGRFEVVDSNVYREKSKDQRKSRKTSEKHLAA